MNFGSIMVYSFHGLRNLNQLGLGEGVGKACGYTCYSAQYWRGFSGF